jgi:hypothetical protein
VGWSSSSVPAGYRWADESPVAVEAQLRDCPEAGEEQIADVGLAKEEDQEEEAGNTAVPAFASRPWPIVTIRLQEERRIEEAAAVAASHRWGAQLLLARIQEGRSYRK